MINAAAESDQNLLAAYQQGEHRAFETLYARYAQAVLAYALGMLGERDRAEDVLQQVFIGFVKQAPTLPRNTCVKAYLFAAARNRITNIRRDRDRAETFAAGYELFVQRRSVPGPDAAAAAQADEVRGRLNAALARLAEEEREVILLHTQGELSFTEMSAALGIPRGTLATRYRSGILRLRELLNHEHA